MFHPRKARPLRPCPALSAVLLCLVSAGCKDTASDAEEAALRAERAEIFAAAPTGEVHDLQRRTEELAAMTEDEVRAAQREHRLSRERVRLLAAAGPPIELHGRIVSAETGAPEVDCHISHGSQETYTGKDGAFTLLGIPSDGQVRVRMKCRGLIERHNLVIPEIAHRYELPDAIELGRSLALPRTDTPAPTRDHDAREAFDGAVAVLEAVPPGPKVQPAVINPSSGPQAQREPHDVAPATPSQPIAEKPAAKNPAATPTPTLALEPEQIVSGSLSAADIAPELRRRAHALHSCYAEFLEANRDARGAVRVRWVISRTGIPEDVEIRQSTFDMPERDECMKRRIARLAFPASDGATTVNQTFVFSFWLNPQDQIQ